MSRSLLLAAAVLALLAGCSPSQAPSAGAASGQAAKASAGPLAGLDNAIPDGQNRGRVLQKMDGAGFSYAEVQVVTGQKIWLAGKQVDFQPGAQVEWGRANLMRDFPSKSLGRNFQEILFVESWNEIGKPPVAVSAHVDVPTVAVHGAAPGAGAPAAPVTAATPDAAGGGAVKSVTNGAGYSFIEVDQGGGQSVWVAAVQTQMKAGDKVRWQGGMVMNNFTAKSVGKTFDKIIFAQAVAVAK